MQAHRCHVRVAAREAGLAHGFCVRAHSSHACSALRIASPPLNTHVQVGSFDLAVQVEGLVDIHVATGVNRWRQRGGGLNTRILRRAGMASDGSARGRQWFPALGQARCVADGQKRRNGISTGAARMASRDCSHRQPLTAALSG